MVDLTEIELFEGDVDAASRRQPLPDEQECMDIAKQQQRYIRQLVEENKKLREKILDLIM